MTDGIARAPQDERRNVGEGREGRVRRLQAEVGSRARQGEPLAEIDHDVITPSGLSEESRSALWLLAWSYQEAGSQRYQARQAQLRHDIARRPPALGCE
jgi:multidrug efflux pump subunit AcrA (membrane-fusion protein)